jgi:uncharacterized protein YjiS (DUF1127 family)
MIVPFPRVVQPIPTRAPETELSLPAQWLSRIAARRELRALLRQPDSVLADCGRTRAAVASEVAKPFWRD